MPAKTEEKKADGTTIGYEMKPLEAASTAEYTLWSVEKIYVNIEFYVKTDKVTGDKHMAGFNFVPTYGHEIRVAVPNDVPIFEKLPTGVIHVNDFDRQFERLADSVLAYRKRILNEGKTDGF